MITAVFLAGSILLLLGLAVTVLVAPRSLRELRGMKGAETLATWKGAPPERTNAIRAAWRSGSPVADQGDAGLAVAMSEHVDRVVAATNRVSWWTCVPLAPGLLLVVASFSRVLWVAVAAPAVLWLAFHPIAIRSRNRRRRSVDLTKRQHAL